MSYFIIISDEDGTRIRGPISKAALLTSITPNEAGDTDYGEDIQYLKTIPDNDKGYWMARGNNMIIIKGDIVVPEVVQKVVELDIV